MGGWRWMALTPPQGKGAVPRRSTLSTQGDSQGVRGEPTLIVPISPQKETGSAQSFVPVFLN